MAMELGEAGVRVNCICPGGIATPIFGRAFGLNPEAADRSVEVVKAARASFGQLAAAMGVDRGGLQ